MLYLDTSALVKAYIDEPLRPAVMAALAKEPVVATHEIAYVEAHSAFVRSLREGRIGERDYERLKTAFNRDWDNYALVRLSQPLLEHAVKLIEAFTLRGYDALHLAAADLLAKQSGERVIFACFDKRLSQAAGLLGLTLLAER